MEYQDIKKLIEDMGNSKLTYLDIEFPDGIKISMKKDQPAEKQNNKVNFLQSYFAFSFRKEH